MRMSGDSMVSPNGARGISPGQNLYIEILPERRFLTEGIYVLGVKDGGILVRRVSPLPGRRLQLIADNPKYPVIILNTEEPGDIFILGRVVGFGPTMLV